MSEQLDNYLQKMHSNPYVVPHVKINSKCIIDLNVKLHTIKCMKENIAENLCDLGWGKDFWDTEFKNIIHFVKGQIVLHQN